jgi:hypothetical protein
MKEIWILCTYSNRCSGHGESMPTIEVATYGWGIERYPAFTSEQAALAYCDDKGLHHLQPFKFMIDK